MISKLASIEEEKTPVIAKLGKSSKNLSGKLDAEFLQKLDHGGD